MADSGSSKALSAHSNNASSASSHLNSKKAANNKIPASSSKLTSSPAKSSNTKPSQPVKPGTPKSNLKSAASTNSLAQKSSPPKTTPANNKRVLPSVDLKNTPELKQTSNEISGKKVSVKSPQQNIVENMKNKSRSVEKLPDAAPVTKALVSKTVSGDLPSEGDRINESKKSVTPTSNNVDPSEVIELLKSVTANIESLGGEFRVSRGSSCDREEISDAASSDKNYRKLKLSDKLKIKSEEEEDFIIVYPGEDTENKLDNFEPSDITRIDLAQRTDNLLSKSDTVISNSFVAKTDNCSNVNPISSQKEIKSPDSSNSTTVSESSSTSVSVAIDSDYLKSISMLENVAFESTLPVLIGSVEVKSLDNNLLQHDFLNEKNDCKFSGDRNNISVSDPIYGVSSNDNDLPVNAACNLASGYFDISNQTSMTHSNDYSTNKDVSDPISTNGVVTKPCDTSKIDDPKVNGENIKSDPSQKSTDCPSDSSQVSPQKVISCKEESTPAPPQEETKQSIRLKVWDILEKKNYVLFPRPCKGRIPHFVGSPEAADRLATLDEFKNARTVKVNPDKPQIHVRFLTLEAGKNLLVPIPRLRFGLFKRIVPHPGATKEQLKALVSHQEIFNSGHEVKLDDKVSIDLVVMGAVAVSKEGYRIGKGEGYADLEFAIMMKMGAITPDTVVITTVHDEQVFDTLPRHLFKEHDVPVDFIVTPNNVYEVTPRLPKPSGIFWNVLSNRRLEQIPILKTLRDQEIAEGNECKLKEVDSDPEDRPVRPFKYFRRQRRTHRDQIKPRSQKPPRENSAPPPISNMRSQQRSRQTRTFRRKPALARSSSAKEQPVGNAESGTNNRRKQQNMVERVRAGGDGVQPMRRPYFRKPRGPIAFSIRVSGISRGTRVRDLKTALSERGVKPYDITWEHSKGQAVLHFSRMEMFKDKKPLILSELPTVDVVEGFHAKLELKLLSNPKACKYSWCINGKPIDLVGRSKIISRLDGTAALVINNVNSEDAGEYTVTIRNKHGEVTSKGTLNVIAKTKADTPEVKPSFFGDEVIVEEVTADKNMPLLISLSISGNPVPDIEWSKDNAILSPTDKIQFLCDGNKVGLRINECRMNDAGEYKCKLTNHLGEAEFTTKVIVNPPSKSINQVNNITKIVSLQDITLAMDDIIASLQDFKVKVEGKEEPQESLSVEPANSISRIESTGISAV